MYGSSFLQSLVRLPLSLFKTTIYNPTAQLAYYSTLPAQYMLTYLFGVLVLFYDLARSFEVHE